jgi:hydroxylamine reductase (hybrid-cluster protein)
MGISPVGGVIYANQQMAGIASEVGAANNRLELQALAAAAVASEQKKEIQEVRPAEENQNVDADREHNKEQAEQEERRASKEEHAPKEEVSIKSLHLLDVKV